MIDKKISIVQIIDQLNVGGAEKMLATLSNLLNRNGHKVKVITTVKPGPLAAQLNKEIEFFCLNRKWKWNPFTMYHLIQQVKGFDIIHVHSSFNLRYYLLASKLFFFNKIVFYHGHYGNVVNENIKWHQQMLYKKVVFIAVSNVMKEWAIKKLHLSAKNVFVLPNIVIREDAGKPIIKKNDVIKIVLVSNFLPNKNIEFAIEILEKLSMPDERKFQLTIIGKPSDKNYFQSIQQLIQKKNLQSSIDIITDCNDVQPLLSQFHFALHTAISESGPLVLLEYLAQGLPFVASNTGEVVQQIKNDFPELIAESFNINEWINKIESLLTKDLLHLTSKMQTVFNKIFSAEKYYETCINIYTAGLNIR